MNDEITLDDENVAESTSAQILEMPSTVEEFKLIVEAVLMASNKVVSLEHLVTIFEPAESFSHTMLKDALAQLELDYAGRGIELKKVAGGYRFQTAVSAAPWVSRLWEERPQRYSRALLETLSLIAYRQPITRGEIEEVRGVSVSSHIMKTLLERQWVRVVGHREVPGRPAIYATTKVFLDYFNLSSLDQLPPLSELRDIDAIAREVSEQLELTVDESSGNSDKILNDHGGRSIEEFSDSEKESIAVSVSGDLDTNTMH